MAGHVLTGVILVVACAGFVAGGVQGGLDAGGITFTALGIVGVVLFGGALVAAAYDLLGRRTVLELDADGVRRPARRPLPRRYDRRLPWTKITAVAALSRGSASRRRGSQDYLVFLSGDGAAETVRAAARPELVALALSDVPADVARSRWPLTVELHCAVEPNWTAPLKDVVKEIRRHDVPFIDRRKD